MRVFTAAFWNETNAFAPFPLDVSAFEEAGLYGPGERPDGDSEGAAVCEEARIRARAGAFDLIEGTCTYAEPSGLVTRAAYEGLRDRILAELQAALPVDIVALGLHGAMAADGYPDCEGDILVRARAIAGPKARIGVLIDPHANLSAEMVSAADVIIAFKEYPHTDFRERAVEVMDLLEAAARGEIDPVMRSWDSGALAIFHTSRPPVRAFVERMQRLEREGAALSVSLVHGFPWGDADCSGTRSLVITDGDAAAADALARQLAVEAAALAPEGMAAPVTLDAAIDQALAAQDAPTVLAESPDNPGGGAAGDSTAVLAQLIARGVRSACLGPLWDPGAVDLAFRAGVGARLDMRIGGKAGRLSGQPVDGEAEVLALDPAAFQTFAGVPVPMGRAAAVRIEGVEVVLVSQRGQALGVDLFTRLGIDPAAKAIVVVKSSRHYEAEFGKISRRMITVDCAGALQINLANIPYRRVRRPRWPIDPGPPTPFPVNPNPVGSKPQNEASS
ncbi:MAG: M81 family metallopeptidase [Caulobacteraceae bacterium]|nr:M81 family metallopeptidase [Caulobacteraceae bacterium]